MQTVFAQEAQKKRKNVFGEHQFPLLKRYKYLEYLKLGPNSKICQANNKLLAFTDS